MHKLKHSDQWGQVETLTHAILLLFRLYLIHHCMHTVCKYQTCLKNFTNKASIAFQGASYQLFYTLPSNYHKSGMETIIHNNLDYIVTPQDDCPMKLFVRWCHSLSHLLAVHIDTFCYQKKNNGQIFYPSVICTFIFVTDVSLMFMSQVKDYILNIVREEFTTL